MGAAGVAAGASLRKPVGGMAQYQLGESPPERASSSGAYREGFEGRTETQGASPAIHPSPLAERQSGGRQASDNQPRQADAWRGW